MRRSTVILLTIFVLLAVLVWFMQTPDNPIKKAIATSTTVAEGLNRSLINSQKGPISTISIQGSAGKIVTIDKTSGKWIINMAGDVPADPNLSESAAAQVLYLQILTELDKAPDAAGTGLDKPDYTVSVTFSDSSLYKFEIGKETVTGSGYYSRTFDGKIYILNKNDVDVLLKIYAEPPFLQTPTPQVNSSAGIPAESISSATPTKVP